MSEFICPKCGHMTFPGGKPHDCVDTLRELLRSIRDNVLDELRNNTPCYCAEVDMRCPVCHADDYFVRLNRFLPKP